MKTINNHVHLIGNLGNDLQVMDFKSGSKKVQGSLATNHYTKNEKGEYAKETQWHKIIGWGGLAEMMDKALGKGNRVAITGCLKYRTYENRKGETQTIAEIEVNEFLKVGEHSKNTKSEELIMA